VGGFGRIVCRSDKFLHEHIPSLYIIVEKVRGIQLANLFERLEDHDRC